MEKCYIQLYSLKDEIVKDFAGTLKRVAEIGYTGVEFAGQYGGMSAAELKKLLGGLKLEALSGHILTEHVAENLDYAAELGMKYIIDPMAGLASTDEALLFAKKLNEAGKLCKDRGITFGYHNHAHEFQKGKDGYLLETLILNTIPEWVCFQLDVGWAAYAGVDSPAFIAKYPGRFKLIHVKECGAAATPENKQNEWNVPAGQGIIDWPAVKGAALSQGAEAFIIEREFNYANDIFKCVEDDFKFLKSL